MPDEKSEETSPSAAEPSTQTTAQSPDPTKQYQVGDKVKGSVPPTGGSWKYDAQKDEIELVEQPTQKD